MGSSRPGASCSLPPVRHAAPPCDIRPHRGSCSQDRARATALSASCHAGLGCGAVCWRTWIPAFAGMTGRGSRDREPSAAIRAMLQRSPDRDRGAVRDPARRRHRGGDLRLGRDALDVGDLGEHEVAVGPRRRGARAARRSGRGGTHGAARRGRERLLGAHGARASVRRHACRHRRRGTTAARRGRAALGARRRRRLPRCLGAAHRARRRGGADAGGAARARAAHRDALQHALAAPLPRALPAPRRAGRAYWTRGSTPASWTT